MAILAAGYGYGGYGSGPLGAGTVLRQIIVPPFNILLPGQVLQCQLIDTFTDGTSEDVSLSVSWVSSDYSVASISTTGLVNCLKPGVATISETSAGDVTRSFTLSIAQASSASVLPSYRSHRTQVLLNYFDGADSRVRQHPYSLDAQLLNTAALALDDSQQRIGRELAARALSGCPAGIDSRGLYYKVKLSNDLALAAGQTEIVTVVGTRGDVTAVLTPYDDRLPRPAGYEAQPDLARVALTDPVLFEVTGSGDATAQVWDAHVLGPFTMATPNTLSFWAEGVAGNSMWLDIFVEGMAFPVPIWPSQQAGTSETVTVSNEGLASGRVIWQSISRVTVRGLPAGVRLRSWQMPFTLPAVADLTRPYTHSTFRDVQFDRYWQLCSSKNRLEEMYMLDNLSTLEQVQSYSTSATLAGVAVEPNTWGMLGVSGTTISYWDRREPLPGHLAVTAMTVEPLYGIDVHYNLMDSGSSSDRWVVVQPAPYAQAAQLSRWRYVLEAPDGAFSVINLDGSLSDYSGGGGWQAGDPVPVSLPLVLTGTYVITIECLGSGNTLSVDSFPYPNLAVPVIFTCDLSGLLSGLEGIAFDAFGQLWVWTGTEAVPIRPYYNAYVLDPASRSIYLTDAWDSVQYE